MTVPSGGEMRVRLVAASLAIALGLASGCQQEESAPTSRPPSPLPTTESGRPVQPKPPATDQGGETKGTLIVEKNLTKVEKDLRKDLAAPVIRPDAPPPPAPPAGKPDSGQLDATKSGRP